MKWLNHKWFAPSELSALYNGGETPKARLKKTANIQVLLQHPFLECGWTCALIITTKLMGMTVCLWLGLPFVCCLLWRKQWYYKSHAAMHLASSISFQNFPSNRQQKNEVLCLNNTIAHLQQSLSDFVSGSCPGWAFRRNQPCILYCCLSKTPDSLKF